MVAPSVGQSDWAQGCPAVRSNYILGASWRMLLGEINLTNGSTEEQSALSHVGGPHRIEQKG